MDKYEKIIVLGGKNYNQIAEELFYTKEVNNLLSGCKGIGYMIQRLNRLIEEQY
jgi:hypothetical protein